MVHVKDKNCGSPRTSFTLLDTTEGPARVPFTNEKKRVECGPRDQVSVWTI